jgi:methylthioribose-1-phosphate isomerase
MRTVFWQDGAVKLIDQTRLPSELIVLECHDWREVAEAIRTMKLRGAPAIGVAAAYGLALAACQSQAVTPAALLADLEEAAAGLRATRPTAVNLAWALERMLRRAHLSPSPLPDAGRGRGRGQGEVAAIRAALLAEAEQMADEDVATNRCMGAYGATLIPDGARILTHCNTGALATVDYGTALGVMRTAHEQGKRLHVWVDETRPYLQGARLTAWELQQLGIPCTLITDNMAGHFMQRGQVDMVFVGGDRVAANGDTANKIGTYSLAVLAQAHGLPFYVVVPTSTIDLTIPDGAHIPIEERSSQEVTHIAGVRIAPEGVAAAHPAFDVTPYRLITAIVTERGIVRPPFVSGLRAIQEQTP